MTAPSLCLLAALGAAQAHDRLAFTSAAYDQGGAKAPDPGSAQHVNCEAARVFCHGLGPSGWQSRAAAPVGLQ